MGVSRARTFFPELEALRGIAVVLVVLFHADGLQTYNLHSEPSLWTDIMRSGHTGVDLFFLLSGFLLALPLLEERWTGSAAQLRTFYARRALRILPLYYFIVLVGALTIVRAPGDALGVLPYFFFLTSFAGIGTLMTPWSDVLWSLNAEVQFYLVLPLLGLARARRGIWLWIGLGALATYAALYAGMVTGRLQMQTIAGSIRLTHSLLGRGPLFLWGIGAAWFYHRYGTALEARLARSWWLKAGIADLVLVVTLLALVRFLGWVGDFPKPLWTGPTGQLWHIGAGALWTAVLLLVLLAPLRLKWVLVNPVLGTLGVLSYSIYLLHVPLLKYGTGAAKSFAQGIPFPTVGAPLQMLSDLLAGWTPASITLVLGIAAGCYVLSTLTYRFVERPFLVRKKQFEPRDIPASTIAGSADAIVPRVPENENASRRTTSPASIR